MEIKTDRLLLREFYITDISGISILLNNIDVSKWLLVFPCPFGFYDAENTVKHMIKRSKEKPRTSYNLAVELNEGKMLIGNIGLVRIDLSNKTGMVMYWLGRNFWGKGYGSEALGKVLKFAFNKLKLRRLSAEVYPGNLGSIKLLEKFGFKKEGVLRKSVVCKVDGKIKDTILYSLLDEEYNVE